MGDSIVVRQRRDHAYLDELMTHYERASPAARRKTFRSIVQLVTTHAFAEEEVLFPRARKLLTSGEALTSLIESDHQRINELLREVRGYQPGEEAFESRVTELFTLLRADLRKEEDRLLPALSRELDESALERLGAAWELAKKTAPNQPHPEISRRPPGNVLAGLPLFVIDRARGLGAKFLRAISRLLDADVGRLRRRHT